VVYCKRSFLHTWGSALTHHPHVHMIVPGGGKSWVSCRPLFLLSVDVLSALFRGLFLDKLRAAYQAGALQFFGKHARLIDPRAFAAYLALHRLMAECHEPTYAVQQIAAYSIISSARADQDPRHVEAQRVGSLLVSHHLPTRSTPLASVRTR
jgi:Putative transposase